MKTVGRALVVLTAVAGLIAASSPPVSTLSMRGDLDPISFGAVADGNSHLLTSGAPLLTGCPQLTAPVETDACAVQASLNAIAAYAPASGVTGTPGGRIRFMPGRTYKLGTQSLTANNMSLTMAGQDQWSSVLLVGANPMLNFGLSNGMGIGSAVIASTGFGFAAGDTNTLTGDGGVCEDPPVITILTVGAAGDILTQSITHVGSCSVQPTLNPLAYTTSGTGSGAVFSGTFAGSGPFTLTGAIVVQTSGTGCVNGETLTGTGGSTPGGSPTQFQLTVTNAISGAIQRGGVSIASPGAYGTPPPNPVSVTGSASCTGAAFNVGAFTNKGGSLTMERLQLVADGPGVSVATAQFNMPNRSTLLRDLVLQATGSSYFGGGFDLTSMTNAVIENIDTNNNLTFFNSNPANALFIVRQQNNLLGHFEHYWDRVSAFRFMGGAIDYLSTSADTVPFQGLKFRRVTCAVGAHCLRLENTGIKGYGNVLIDDLYATQTTQQIEIKMGLGVTITNGGFGLGTTRVTSPPSQADMVVLDSVNQWTMRGNVCAAALPIPPSATCFHIKGTSSFGISTGNIITNAAKTPTFIGYVFDSGTALNQQSGDYFNVNVTPVQDSGTNNTTFLSPPVSPPCVSHAITSGETFTVPDTASCVYFNNSASALTVVMPANPADNQVVGLNWFGNVTTLTVQANTGQVLGGAPTTATSLTPFAWKNIGLRWQRVVN